LNASKTRATDAGLQALQQALPKLKWPLVPNKGQFSTTSLPYDVVGLKLEDEAGMAPSHP